MLKRKLGKMKSGGSVKKSVARALQAQLEAEKDTVMRDVMDQTPEVALVHDIAGTLPTEAGE